mgnify:CR=1 FL=1
MNKFKNQRFFQAICGALFFLGLMLVVLVIVGWNNPYTSWWMESLFIVMALVYLLSSIVFFRIFGNKEVLPEFMDRNYY